MPAAYQPQVHSPEPAAGDTSFAARMRAAYAERIAVPRGKRSWDVAAPGYNPSSIYVPKLAGAPAPLLEGAATFVRYNGKKVRFDDNGVPLHPLGRQGIAGIGAVSGWGPRLAADAMVVTNHPTLGECVLAIHRNDNKLWALPGGKVDRLADGTYETPATTTSRELGEEVGIDIGAERFARAMHVYSGFLRGQRDTDNAWLETSVNMLRVPWDEARSWAFTREAGSVIAIAWIPLDEAVGRIGTRKLEHASHWRLVRRAQRLATRAADASTGST